MALPKTHGGEDGAERLVSARTYRLEHVRCGKPACKRCRREGVGHGPYWYAYWRSAGRVRKAYLGRELPRDDDDHRFLRCPTCQELLSDLRGYTVREGRPTCQHCIVT